MSVKLTEVAAMRSWSEAFDYAVDRLNEEQLTSVGFLSATDYDSGRYRSYPINLEGLGRQYGCAGSALEQLRAGALMVWGEATRIRLSYGGARHIAYSPQDDSLVGVDEWRILFIHNG